MHSQMKGQKVMMLIGLFSLLSAVLIPVLGPALGGMIVGGALLGIAALSLIYPYSRPAPTFLPLAQNWTQLYEKGQLPVVSGRKESVDEIAATLIGGKGVKMHPMLIGKSGVGKTENGESSRRGDCARRLSGSCWQTGVLLQYSRHRQQQGDVRQRE